MVHKHAAGKHPKQPKPPKQPVTVTAVDPDALVVAWQIAEGDGKRIQVIDFSTIRVHNHAWR